MAYAPITKLDNFTGKEDDAQVWLNDIEKAIAANEWNDAQAMQAIPYFFKDTADLWYQSLINKPQDFNAFKVEFLRYFSNNNSINSLVNAFTTIKQGETETQLTPTISQHQISLSMACTLQDVVTRARDFESTESETNHAQAVNLVINGLSKLDSKLEKFSESINKRLKGYLADNYAIYQNSNYAQNQPCSSSSTNQQWQQEMYICHYCGKQEHIQIDSTNLSTTSISTSDLSAVATSNISTTATNHLSTPTNLNTTPESSSNDIRQLLIQSHSKLEIGDSCLPTDSQFAKPTIRITHPEFGYHLLVNPEDATSYNMESNQHIPPNTIPLATISSDKSLAAIFPFELEENTLIPLFSRATLEEKPITAMYTDARVDGHSIKLILDSGSAGSIITRQLIDQLGCRVDRAASTRIITADGATKTPIGKIDDFLIEINSIIVLIKVIVMDATQYQALIAICGHFKATNNMVPLIDFDKKKLKPTWKAYQVLWADEEHNELPPILFWDNNNKGKGKQKEELTWETDDLI
ncbi:hypothetical protein G9A89_022926 [Geosiphon pyriformis]|nr:hypothetical protein G9A89_022926 [Geosiphon pyriformis]